MFFGGGGFGGLRILYLRWAWGPNNPGSLVCGELTWSCCFRTILYQWSFSDG